MVDLVSVFFISTFDAVSKSKSLNFIAISVFRMNSVGDSGVDGVVVLVVELVAVEDSAERVLAAAALLGQLVQGDN